MRGSQRAATMLLTIALPLAATANASAAPLPELPPTLSAGAVSALLPPAGEGVFAEALLAGAPAQTLILQQGAASAAGQNAPPTIAVTSPAQDAVDEAVACTDDAHAQLPWREDDIHRWYFNAASIAPGLSVAATEAAAIRATDSITGSVNGCALTDNVSARAQYLGTTTAATNVGANGACLDRDGTSVVGFGTLPSNTLAVACVWYATTEHPYEVFESDVRLNRGSFSWYTEPPLTCTWRFDVESVLTHERGHTFGLGHVSESSHGSLTMSEMTRDCSTSQRTLGSGDVRGLEALY